MIIVIDTDLDSPITNKNGEKIEPFLYGSGFAFLVKTKEDKEQFIEDWYNRKFGLNDRVFDTLNNIFHEISYSILNDNFGTIENGNYSIMLLNENLIY